MSTSSGADAFGSVFDALNGGIERLGQGLALRLEGFGRAGADLAELGAAMASAGVGSGSVLASGLLIAAVTLGSFAGVRHLLARRRPGAGIALRCLQVFVAFVASATAGITLARLGAPGPSAMRATLSIIAVAAALGALIVTWQSLLIAALGNRPDRVGPSVRRFTLQLNIAIAYALAGAALLAILRAWGAGTGLRDLIATFGVAAIATLGLMAGALANRRTVAALVGGPRPRSRRRGWLARCWPLILVSVFGLTFVKVQLAQTLGTPLPAIAVIATLAAVIALPFVDRLLKRWTAAGQRSASVSLLRVAMRMTVRPALLAGIGGLLCALWFGPFLADQSAGASRYVSLALTLALLGLLSAFCWNVIGLLYLQAMEQDIPSKTDEEMNRPRSRFQTLAPLLAGVGRWAIITFAGLSALLVLGINVWPIVTGLSVFGIAIGFGSQALVKDVVSGIFFLIDDAFRQGEYIETSGAKGVVEKISIRSVSLRHQRGALATIPYGAIGRIQNYSRDWVIVKLLFRVALDTDVELVRKLFKKIGQEIAADPELAVDLMDTFKSQGIAELEDGTLVVRGKFKARAGRQHMIRRRVLSEVHKAFQQNGIRAVPKPLDAARAA
jgi:small-conductance mechanosensitive channel